MNVTSLSFTYLQVSATTGAAPMRKAAGGEPSPAPQAVAADDCSCPDDKPRRSPFVRALKEALLEVAESVKASGAATTAAAGTAVAKTDDAADESDLSDALMDFARALMQTLREQGGGERRAREHGEHHHRHHRHGHDHGRMQWGDPAQRIEALSQQVASTAAPTPAAPASPTPPAVQPLPPVASQPAEPTTAAPANDSASGTAPQPVVTGGTGEIVVSLRITQQAESSPFAGLLDAFAKLQQALGKRDDDDSALPKALSEFLQSLAAKLRGEEVPTLDAATEPGALIDLAA